MFGRRLTLLLIATFLVMFVAVVALSALGYLIGNVRNNEVGLRFYMNEVIEVVGPGIYWDLRPFADIKTYSKAEYRFSVSDPEVLTLDRQRLGVSVSGSVFRPDESDQDKIRRLWSQYKGVFESNEALQAVMQDLTMQAMKVCVGDKPFEDSVVGSDRDALRTCINDELIDLTTPYGLTVLNVVVPNVALSTEVQAKLDAITVSRLDTEKAKQDEQRALAQGRAAQAEQEAIIRAEQSRLQETARQEAILAELQAQRLIALKAQIEADKANQMLGAEKDLEIQKVLVAVAAEKAKAALAEQIALAQMYAENPEYLTLMMVQANASAIKATDKLIFTPEGVFPNLVFGNGVMPTFPVGPSSTVPVPTPVP